MKRRPRCEHISPFEHRCLRLVGHDGPHHAKVRHGDHYWLDDGQRITRAEAMGV